MSLIVDKEMYDFVKTTKMLDLEIENNKLLREKQQLEKLIKKARYVIQNMYKSTKVCTDCMEIYVGDHKCNFINIQ